MPITNYTWANLFLLLGYYKLNKSNVKEIKITDLLVYKVVKTEENTG